MARHKRREIGALVVDGVAIITGLTRAKYISPLPEHVTSNSGRGKCRILPWTFDCGLRCVCCAIFFQNAGLVGGDAGSTVVSDPAVTPVVRLSPRVWVKVQGTEVKIGDFEVGGEIDAFTDGVRVTVVTTTVHESLIT